MKFLIIAQDLRVSGTSEGIVSRSFLGKLRKTYPEALIEVLYLKHAPSDDELELLPVNRVTSKVLNLKIPFYIKWINKIYWRIFNFSLNEEYIHKKYATEIIRINYKKYDHIFIRSSGIDHEMLLASADLPILKKSIINFHDPYPLFWYPGSNIYITSLDFGRFKKMLKVVSQAKTCISSASFMSRDLEFLYGTRKHFYTLPHQYSEEVFNHQDVQNPFKKSKEVTISYHGALQFGRNIEVVLDAYVRLLENNFKLKNKTEFVLRLKSAEYNRLFDKYKFCPEIVILESTDFVTSCYEQQYQSDILIVLENGPIYCNILTGKAPVLAHFKKPVLVVCPKVSELRNIISNESYVANMTDEKEIELKLRAMINERFITKEPVFPFEDFFSDEHFKIIMNKIIGA